MRVKVTVRNLKDRRYLQLHWLDPTTGDDRFRSAKTSDPREAEQARADLEYELSHGLASEPGRVTWQSFRDAFEAEYLPGVRVNTQRCYRKALDLAEELVSVPTLLSSFGARQASAFVAAMRALPPGRRKGITTYKASTIAIHVQYLKGALSWATTMGMIPAVPAFPEAKLPLTTPQPVPAELYDRLLAVADQQMRAYLQCAWLAGLRRNEAYHLQREPCDDKPYLDLQRRRIVFPAASVKGARDQWVPLAAELQADLDALPRHGVDVFRFGRKADNMSGLVEALAKRAKVRLTYRSLRRGFGCRYAARVPAQVLQKLMRHANINTTLQFYVSIDGAVEAAVFGAAANSAANSRDENARIPVDL